MPTAVLAAALRDPQHAAIEQGRRWGRLALTLAHRSFVLAPGYLAASSRAGARVRIVDPLGMFVEGGATYHTKLRYPGAGFFNAEGALGL